MQSNSKVLFSIIMPCFNSEDYVENAIESVRAQTYDSWELIAVNDGSTDNTPSILQRWAETDSRIKYFSKQNGGYVSAVNYGLNLFHGDYFLFLGSDDRLTSGILDAIYQNLGNELPDIIGFRAMKYSPDKTEADEHTDYSTFVYVNNTSFAAFQKEYPVHSDIFSTRDTSKCFHRHLLGDLRYYGKTGLDADGIFSMKLAHKATSFMSLPVVGYDWFLRSDSLSGRTVTKKTNYDRIKNWIEFYRYVMAIDNTQLAPSEISYLSYFLSIMKDFCLGGHKTKDENHLIKEGRVCVIKTAKHFDIPIPKQHRLFLFSPAFWLFSQKPTNIIRKVKKELRRRLKHLKIRFGRI